MWYVESFFLFLELFIKFGFSVIDSQIKVFNFLDNPIYKFL